MAAAEARKEERRALEAARSMQARSGAGSSMQGLEAASSMQPLLLEGDVKSEVDMAAAAAEAAGAAGVAVAAGTQAGSGGKAADSDKEAVGGGSPDAEAKAAKAAGIGRLGVPRAPQAVAESADPELAGEAGEAEALADAEEEAKAMAEAKAEEEAAAAAEALAAAERGKGAYVSPVFKVRGSVCVCVWGGGGRLFYSWGGRRLGFRVRGGR